MIYLPVFGKDSVPHSSSRLLGFCSTMILWTIFFIAMILIGSKKEPKVKYETVQIQLSPHDHYIPDIPEDFLAGKLASGEVEQEATSDSAPAAVSESVPVPSPAPKPAPAKPKTQPVQKPAQTKAANNVQTKTTDSKSSSAPSLQSYSNSVEDAFANQTNNTTAKKAPVWDDSLFADSSNAATNSSKGQKGVVSQDNTYSGSAANSSSSYNQTQTSSSSASSNSGAKNNTVSEGTASALQSLQNTQAQTVSSDRGTETRTSMKTTQSGDGKNMVQMSDGSSRALLQPSTIAIPLSLDAQKAISDNCEVEISFVVNENGYVASTITISPESSLPQIVKDEIRTQIRSWRFESADNTSRGKFTLKLIKK